MSAPDVEAFRKALEKIIRDLTFAPERDIELVTGEAARLYEQHTQGMREEPGIRTEQARKAIKRAEEAEAEAQRLTRQQQTLHIILDKANVAPGLLDSLQYRIERVVMERDEARDANHADCRIHADNLRHDAEKRISSLEAENAKLRECVQRDMEVFREYEALHRKKAPIGVCALPTYGDFQPTCVNCGASRTMHEHAARSLAKANVNGDHATRCAAALGEAVPTCPVVDTSEADLPKCGQPMPCGDHGVSPTAAAGQEGPHVCDWRTDWERVASIVNRQQEQIHELKAQKARLVQSYIAKVEGIELKSALQRRITALEERLKLAEELAVLAGQDVRRSHTRVIWAHAPLAPECYTCNEPWPCPSITALARFEESAKPVTPHVVKVEPETCSAPKRSGSNREKRFYPCPSYAPGELGGHKAGSLCDCGFRESEHGPCGNALPCALHPPAPEIEEHERLGVRRADRGKA